MFIVSFFPLDVLDEIWDVIESVSEEFLTYTLLCLLLPLNTILIYNRQCNTITIKAVSSYNETS